MNTFVPPRAPLEGATTLCIARHGETDWNANGVLQGWFDIPINARGREQAVLMAEQLAHHRFTAVWTSPLVRASETAEIIAARWGLSQPQRHEGIKERHFGLIQGIPKAELGESNPLLLQQILIRNPAAHFEGGENMDEVANRVIGAIAEIGRIHAGERALVITHGWVMDVMTRYVSNLRRHTILGHKPKNGETLWLAVDAVGIVGIATPE